MCLCVEALCVSVYQVGYGDIAPDTDWGKIYIMAFILVGTCIGSVFLGYLAEWVLSAQERAAEMITVRKEAEVQKDFDRLRSTVVRGAGHQDEDASPPEPSNNGGSARSVLRALLVVVIFSAIGEAVEVEHLLNPC